MRPGIERLGLIKTSLIDFPGRVSSVLFTSGCNFKCAYCHNPHLACGEIPDDFLPVDEILDHLRRRRHVLDGVVITGGEPLLHQELGDLVEEIRRFGLLVKIDTNGSFPDRLRRIRPDYVAVDIKCAPDRYQVLTEIPDPVARLKETIAVILENDIEHEFRTTVVPGLVDIDGFREILPLIRGARRYVLNEFRPGQTLAPGLRHATPYSKQVFEQLKSIALAEGIPCTLRGPTLVT